MQYLSGFLSASSSAAPLSAQQKCPLLNPECSEKYLKKFFLVNSPMILCYFGLVEEFDPTASPSMSVLRQYRLGPVLACSQLLEPSFSIRVEHPKIQSSLVLDAYYTFLTVVFAFPGCNKRCRCWSPVPFIASRTIDQKSLSQLSVRSSI